MKKWILLATINIFMFSNAHATNIETGAIANDDDARQKCPGVCLEKGMAWSGNWVTKTEGATSVCMCKTNAAQQASQPSQSTIEINCPSGSEVQFTKIPAGQGFKGDEWRAKDITVGGITFTAGLAWVHGNNGNAPQLSPESVEALAHRKLEGNQTSIALECYYEYGSNESTRLYTVVTAASCSKAGNSKFVCRAVS